MSLNSKVQRYYEALASQICDARETRNLAPDFSEFDIELIRAFASVDKSLLDLGAGTGLTTNYVSGEFKTVVAVEKMRAFSDFIERRDNVDVVVADILNFETELKFDVITLFGVMNYFDRHESIQIYSKIRNWIETDGCLIVKHQMGIETDKAVGGFSKELQTDYFSEYRTSQNEIQLINNAGMGVVEIIDVYPQEYNRWEDTHFLALVCAVT